MNQDQHSAHTADAGAMYRKKLWAYYTVMMLGVWLIVFPFTFDIGQHVAVPSGGRELWLSLPQRITIFTWSDVISGIILLFFGWRSLTPGRPVSIWICCLVGVWLNIAPLVFWSPTAALYTSDTLSGILIIALTILIPGMPGMSMNMHTEANLPEGWSYNPSSWPQRWIMIVLGMAGWLVSRYLAAYQFGFIPHVYDPFFGEGSRLVLDSDMSHGLPVSDAGLGAFAYTFEFLMGFMGSEARWRTMPWMVLFFGLLVIPLGLVHIFLVVSQPLIVGHWCSFCILAACIMLPMIPLEVDEVIAMMQFMRQSRKEGKSLWHTFWMGGMVSGAGHDARTPDIMALPQKPGPVLASMFWGLSCPWNLLLATAAGIFVMACPGIFSVEGMGADLCHLGGALIVVFSVLAYGEPIRAVRFLSIPTGLLLAVWPWFLADVPVGFQIGTAAVSLLVVGISLPLSFIRELFGRWQHFIR